MGALGKDEPGDVIDCVRSYVKNLVLPSSCVPSTCHHSTFSHLRCVSLYLCTPSTQEALQGWRPISMFPWAINSVRLPSCSWRKDEAQRQRLPKQSVGCDQKPAWTRLPQMRVLSVTSGKRSSLRRAEARVDKHYFNLWQLSAQIDWWLKQSVKS